MGFKRAPGKFQIVALHWGAGVVKTLLIKITLASKFNKFTTDSDDALLFYVGILQVSSSPIVVPHCLCLM